jgi:hypothetical protein
MAIESEIYPTYRKESLTFTNASPSFEVDGSIRVPLCVLSASLEIRLLACTEDDLDGSVCVVLPVTGAIDYAPSASSGVPFSAESRLQNSRLYYLRR